MAGLGLRQLAGCAGAGGALGALHAGELERGDGLDRALGDRDRPVRADGVPSQHPALVQHDGGQVVADHVAVPARHRLVRVPDADASSGEGGGVERGLGDEHVGGGVGRRHLDVVGWIEVLHVTEDAVIVGGGAEVPVDDLGDGGRAVGMEGGAGPHLLDVLGIADEGADGGTDAQQDATAAQQGHVEASPRSCPHGAGG